MDVLLEPINVFLISPPGNLIFHLVLVFSLASAIQITMITWRDHKNPTGRRMLVGFGIILIAQLVVFMASALAWQGVASSHLLLPPFDRALTVFSLAWAIWLWGFAKPVKMADLLVAIFSLAIIVLTIISLTAWQTEAIQKSFNSSWLDWSWNVLAVLVIIAGILYFLFQRPDGWGMALAFLNVNLVGIMIHLLWGNSAADFIAPLRFAQICTYPLFPTLANRLIGFSSRKADKNTPSSALSLETLRPWEILQPWVSIQPSSKNADSRTLKAVIKTFQADTGVLYQINTDNQASFISISSKDPVRVNLTEYPNLQQVFFHKTPQTIPIKSDMGKEWPLLLSTLQIKGNPSEIIFLPAETKEIPAFGILLIYFLSNSPTWNEKEKQLWPSFLDLFIQKSFKKEDSETQSTLLSIQNLQQNNILLQDEIQQLRATIEKQTPLIQKTEAWKPAYPGKGEMEELPLADISGMVDQVVDETSATLLEKEISLELDVPSVIPTLPIDKDVCKLILVLLLQNAGNVTPANGKITLRIRLHQNSGSEEFLSFQVTDSGGGIDTIRLPEIFTLRNEQLTPIQGISDFGTGLATVKTLVETLEGQIHVESKNSQTSYQVILPFSLSKK